MRYAGLKPLLRRVAVALGVLTAEDREELVQMLELGALVRETRTVLIREVEREEERGEE